jgi:hypothetical protein
MKKIAVSALLALVTSFVATSVSAKLPPASDEAKAKAAEAAAKTAWTGKLDGYLLCKSQDTVAAHYYKTSKSTKPAAATPPCADPGPFVYPLPEAAAAPAGAAPAATPAGAAPAPAAIPAKKS